MLLFIYNTTNMARFENLAMQRDGILECLAVLLVCAVGAVDTRTLSDMASSKETRDNSRHVGSTKDFSLAKLSPDSIETGLLFPYANTFSTSRLPFENKDILSKDKIHTILDLDNIPNPPFASERSGNYRNTNRQSNKDGKRMRSRRINRVYSTTGLRRHRRRFEGLKTRACEVVTTYRQLDEAEDTAGNVVKVMSHMHVGGALVEQFFYESYCNTEACNCKGVDSHRYKSACETSYAFAYARVMKHGETGWRHIKIRSGCACIVTKTMTSEPFSILDIISR